MIHKLFTKTSQKLEIRFYTENCLTTVRIFTRVYVYALLLLRKQINTSNNIIKKTYAFNVKIFSGSPSTLRTANSEWFVKKGSSNQNKPSEHDIEYISGIYSENSNAVLQKEVARKHNKMIVQEQSHQNRKTEGGKPGERDIEIISGIYPNVQSK